MYNNTDQIRSSVCLYTIKHIAVLSVSLTLSFARSNYTHNTSALVFWHIVTDRHGICVNWYTVLTAQRCDNIILKLYCVVNTEQVHSQAAAAVEALKQREKNGQNGHLATYSVLLPLLMRNHWCILAIGIMNTLLQLTKCLMYGNIIRELIHVCEKKL